MSDHPSNPVTGHLGVARLAAVYPHANCAEPSVIRDPQRTRRRHRVRRHPHQFDRQRTHRNRPVRWRPHCNAHRDTAVTHTLEKPLRTSAVHGLVDVITTVFMVASTGMATGTVSAATLRQRSLLDSSIRATPVAPFEPA